MHEFIREQSMAAWEVVRSGEPNPLAQNLSRDTEILNFLSPEEILELMDYRSHVGNAPEKAREMAEKVGKTIGQN